jgi:hypothetical protein
VLFSRPDIRFSTGLVALVAAIDLACSLAAQPLWNRLVQQYATDSKEPSGSKPNPRVALMGKGDGPQTENYSGLAVMHLDATGLYLSIPGLGRGRRAILIPVSELKACSRGNWPSGWHTFLWAGKVAVNIGFLDNNGEVVEWCEEQGIPVVDRATVERWRNE